MFFLGDIPICVTLELPWKDNQHGISCIPAGQYHCIPHNSPAHPNCWQLINVPNRDDILIHVGDFLEDTLGCILAGLQFDGTMLAIRSSNAAMMLLRKTLPLEFDLEIIELN